jgi:hypothetical protein
MVKPHMIGKEISGEELEKIIQINEANRSQEQLKTIENFPTMQTGYNEDGTIREERIKPYVYELNNKDK